MLIYVRAVRHLMFGYTVPVETTMSSYETQVYRNYYCETCHQLRDGYGYISTMTLNYEMTFASLLLNSLLDDGILIEGEPKGRICVIRPSAGHTDILHRLAAYSILVTNNSLVDDKADKPSLKANLGLLGLNRAINKAATEFPDYHKLIMDGYEGLRQAERSNAADPLVMGDLSAKSMLDVLDKMLGGKFDAELREMFHQLGIWVYVMDAVEDLDQDHRDGTYNPFLSDCTDFVSMHDYVTRNIYRVSGLLGSVIGNIQRSYVALRPRLRFNQPIIDNIIYQGMPISAQRVLHGDTTMTPSLKNMMSERLNRGVPQSMV
jgi:hypothetical protein